jgi:hypothetical protein
MLEIIITNKLSGTDITFKYGAKDIEDAKKTLIELASKDDYFEAGDVIEIKEV